MAVIKKLSVEIALSKDYQILLDSMTLNLSYHWSYHNLVITFEAVLFCVTSRCSQVEIAYLYTYNGIIKCIVLQLQLFRKQVVVSSPEIDVVIRELGDKQGFDKCVSHIHTTEF